MEIKVDLDYGVFIFHLSMAVRDERLEELRQRLKQQIAEGVVLTDDRIQFVECVRKWSDEALREEILKLVGRTVNEEDLERTQGEAGSYY